MQWDSVDKTCARILDLPGRRLSGLALVVMSGGKIIHEGYFGVRRFAADRGPVPGGPPGAAGDQPVDRHTRWRAASLSKPVTTLGALKLMDRGLLEADRDLSEYLGFTLRNPHFPQTPITLRMLLGHTSSLRDAEFYYPPLSRKIEDLLVPGGAYYQDGIHFAAPEAGADRSPGHTYCYCNLGYGILGNVVEKISGLRFDLYMQKEILGPLGLDASFNPALLSEAHFDDLSPIYRKCPSDSEDWNPNGPWIPQIDNYRGVRPSLPVRVPRDSLGPFSLDDYRLGDNGSLFSPQGGLRICARDLAKIAAFILGDGEGLLSERSLRMMRDPRWRRDEESRNAVDENVKAYATGFGLMQSEGTDGNPGPWGHHGNAYGLLGGLYLFPETDSAYVYFIGGTGARPESNLGSTSGHFTWEETLRKSVEGTLAKS
jgi:CubicO group peptidase (beta-lactamase class C family)